MKQLVATDLYKNCHGVMPGAHGLTLVLARRFLAGGTEQHAYVSALATSEQLTDRSWLAREWRVMRAVQSYRQHTVRAKYIAI